MGTSCQTGQGELSNLIAFLNLLAAKKVEGTANETKPQCQSPVDENRDQESIPSFKDNELRETSGS